MKYILDTSAILSRRYNLAGAEIIVPSSVMDEIRKGKLKSVLDSLEGTIMVMSPSTESLESVRKKAGESGDLGELSETDLEVISLAFELKGTVITDDFAIQNVASMLGIKFQGADLSGIKSEVVWRYRCRGCGRVYRTQIAVCSICGHEVVRSRKVSRSRKTNGNVNDRTM